MEQSEDWTADNVEMAAESVEEQADVMHEGSSDVAVPQWSDQAWLLVVGKAEEKHDCYSTFRKANRIEFEGQEEEKEEERNVPRKMARSRSFPSRRHYLVPKSLH